MTDAFATPLAGALAMAERGMYLIPVDPPEPGKPKKPAIRGWKQKATTDVDQIRQWAEQFPGCNFGIATGPSGLVVADEDALGDFHRWTEAERIQPPTPTFAVSTGREGGGTHYWYRTDTEYKASSPMKRAGFDVDVRARGGFVVCPGSVHASGDIYEIVNDVDPAPLPPAIAARLRRPDERMYETEQPSEPLPDLHDAAYLDAAQEALRQELADAAGAPLGAAPRWEPTVMHVAYRVVELSNCSPALFPRDAALAFLMEHSPQDGGFDSDDIERKFATACAEKGYTGGREGVQASPRDDFDPYAPGDDAHEQEVLRELARLVVRDEARRRFDLQRAPAPEPWDAGTLSEHLMKTPPPPARIDGLIPWEASTAIIAQRKTGKTTLELNLARSLITGEPFLGAREVLPVEGRVALLNFEVSGAQIALWAQKAGIPPDRLFIVNLRGASNPFQRPEELTRLASLLRSQEVESLIVDPFGRAFTGDSQNDAGQVQGWLLTLDAFARRDVGALDVVLSVHAGWNGERARGSSAMEDWADSLINLTRKEDETRGTDDRFIRADGRDVDLPEDQLVFDASQLRLTLSGYGSRKTANAARKISALVPGVVSIATRHPGIKAGEIGNRLREDGFSFQRGDESKAARHAVEEGLLEARPGSHGATHYYPPGDVPEGVSG